MRYFIAKTVSKEGLNLMFGDTSNDTVTVFDETWTMATILEFLGVEIGPEKDQEIPRGLSQFEAVEGDFDQNVFILNL